MKMKPTTESTGFRHAVTILVAATCLLMKTAQAADDLSKPIRVSPDGHFLMQADGKPFFWTEELALSISANLTKDEVDTYLQDRAHKGFNVVRIVATLAGDLRPFDSIDRYGNKDFVDYDPAKPNEKYWQFIDWIIARATHYDLRVALVPVWGLATVNVAAAPISYDENRSYVFGRWLAERYRSKVFIWVLGGDATPIWNGNVTPDGAWTKGAAVRLRDYRPVYDAMARAIIEVQGEDAFITYSISCCSWGGTAEPRTSLYFSDRPWLDMNNLQSGPFENPESFLNRTGLNFGWDSRYSYQPIRAEYDSVPTRPVIDGDNAAEDSPVDFDVKQKRYTAYDLRVRAYHSVFSGAAGVTYVNHNIGWFFYDPDREMKMLGNLGIRYRWSSQLDAPGARQIARIKSLMLSRPYFARIPDQSIIIGETGVGSAHISGTRDKTGSFMMIYLPEGQPVTVDMIKLSGATANAWWFDPRTGQATQVEGTFPTNTQQKFIPLSSGRDHDWVLVLDDAGKGYPAPGRNTSLGAESQ
jgi:hypothetical protein